MWGRTRHMMLEKGGQFIRDIKAFSGTTPKSLSQKADAFHGVAGYSCGEPPDLIRSGASVVIK